MKVLLVTSWDTPCGIAEHSALLKASVEAADPTIEVIPDSRALDPLVCFTDGRELPDLVHLNHHDALHSRWTAEHVYNLTRVHQIPVILTYHDTRERIQDCPKLLTLASVASSTVVHERVEGLNAIYWRQGIPDPATLPKQYLGAAVCPGYVHNVGDGMIPFKAYPQQPVLGTVGFNFPWKNFDKLAEVTGGMGWALVLIANNATEADAARWRHLNSSVLVIREFVPQREVINYLAACDATAFMYQCSNTGTSAAIRQGVAARKSVIAFKGCRQFRDLEEEFGIIWAKDWDDFAMILGGIEPMAWDPGISELAHQDSWAQLGKNYADLYKMVWR